MEDKDEIILEKLNAGDVSAYKILFKRYYKLLSMQAFYILDDEMESEDLVQILFSEIWEKQLYRNINSSLKAYLIIAVKNRSLKILEKRKTALKRIDRYIYTLNHEEYADVERNKATDNLYNLLEELPRQRQQAFTLVHIEEKKYREVAVQMGITVNSVKTHLKLAVKELRQRIIDLK